VIPIAICNAVRLAVVQEFSNERAVDNRAAKYEGKGQRAATPAHQVFILFKSLKVLSKASGTISKFLMLEHPGRRLKLGKKCSS